MIIGPLVSGCQPAKYIMARQRRYTVRLSAAEFTALTNYADGRHMPLSVGVRSLLSAGLQREPRQQPQDSDHTKDASA